MKKIQEKVGFICDMDGVIYHGNRILDGVVDFLNWMTDNDKRFVFLTNSPEKTPHELSMKLERMGLFIPVPWQLLSSFPDRIPDAQRMLLAKPPLPRPCMIKKYI